MPQRKNKGRRKPSKRANRQARTMKTIKLVKKLQKAGLIDSSGYSLELPFSKRLSISGTVDYAAKSTRYGVSAI